MCAATGLLLITSPLVAAAHHQLRVVLSQASRLVRKTLYVQLEPGLERVWPLALPSAAPVSQCAHFIASLYAKSHHTSRHLDVRVLLATVKDPSKTISVAESFEIILTDQEHSLDDLRQYLTARFGIVASLRSASDGNPNGSTIPVVTVGGESTSNGLPEPAEDKPWKLYRNVVLGGTFDRLHNAHKILLSSAILRTTNQLTVGVTNGHMLKKKLLWELIEPLDHRIAALHRFLHSVDPSINYLIVPITDPFGPSTVDPALESIVVSEETHSGGHSVNKERCRKGLSELEMAVVPLAADDDHAENEEQKISSSTTRMRLLGTLYRKPQMETWARPPPPYIIGLTGGIASGKSSIARTLQSLGAAVVDCDRLGHAAYRPGTSGHAAVVQNFGADVLQSNNEIDRRILGEKVFSEPRGLKLLNSIIWPEIKQLVLQEIERLRTENQCPVVVIEAAVLIEAGWMDFIHEVWLTMIPRDETVKRLIDRNQLTEEQAYLRILSQLSNEERLQVANVVFCSLWEKEYTRQQVERAWSELQHRLQSTVQ